MIEAKEGNEMESMKAFLLILLATSAMSFADITAKDLLVEAGNHASGDFLVTDVVEKITAGLGRKEYRVRMGGAEFPLDLESAGPLTFTGKELISTERSKRSGASHTSTRPTSTKETLISVGGQTTLIVRLAEGRLVSSKIATEEEILTARFRGKSAQPGGQAALNAEVQARALLIEIAQLEAEIKSGVAGTAQTQGSAFSTSGTFVSTSQTTTYRFSATEIESKKKLLALKRAQLAVLS